MTELNELLWNHAVENEDWAEAARIETAAREGRDPTFMPYAENKPDLTHASDAVWYAATSGLISTPEAIQSGLNTLERIAFYTAKQGRFRYTAPKRVVISKTLPWTEAIIAHAGAHLLGTTAAIDALTLVGRNECLTVRKTAAYMLKINDLIYPVRNSEQAARASLAIVTRAEILFEQAV